MRITVPYLPWLPYVQGAEVTDADVVRSELRWESDDPEVIRVEFEKAGDGKVPWEFSRELLHTALRAGEAGVGDVRLSCAGGTLMLILDSPFGVLALRTKAEYLERFLRDTFVITPLEAVDYTPAVDEAIEMFLGRA